MINNTNLYMLIILIISSIIILLIIILIIMGVKKKKKKNQLKTRKKIQNEYKTQEYLTIINKNLETMNEENKKVISIHNQIKDKSEVMNKIFEQTNNLYKEMLDREKEVELSKSKINYQKINKQEKEIDKNQYLNILDTINGKIPGNTLGQTTNNLSKKNLEQDLFEDNIIDKMDNIKIEDLMRLDEEDINEIIKKLTSYKKTLNQEVEYYLDEIKDLNVNVSDPQKRLAKKEEIYKKLKEIDNLIEKQKNLIVNIKKSYQKIQEEEKNLEKENAIDNLIKEIINKKS